MSEFEGNRGRPAMEDHFSKLLRLLELESAAEAQQLIERTQRLTGEQAEQTGQTLTNLTVREETVALGGRMLWTLGKRAFDQPLPWNRLGTGTPVVLSEEAAGNPSAWRGIVTRRADRTIQVAFDELPESEQERPTFRLDLAYDEIARLRQRAALTQVRAVQRGRLYELRRVLLGERQPSFLSPQPLVPLNPNLNASQQEAVEFALAAKDVAVIHGPPGTGKTTTVVEFIRQAIRRGEKVLACAPSNLGVDNLLERLVAAGEKAVRLGHPARVLPELQQHTLDLLVDEHPDMELARKFVREGHALLRKAARYTRAKPEPGARREMRQDARQLFQDARRVEQQLVDHILDSATVLCATLTGLDRDFIGERQFDVAVVDEAAQATEPACWIPLLGSDRLVLAGDHCQLPPTVIAPQAVREGFHVSLMERIVQQFGSSVSRLLKTQYRMHEAIMGFSSSEFYGGELVADASVREHLLADLPGIASAPLSTTPLRFIDTAGAGYDEELEPDGESRRNPQEATLVAREALRLIESGLAPRDLAIISPYAAQVRLIREQLRIEGLEIDTVDGFQGREKEAVLMSLVRSNPQGDIGFLADVRRLNVALTRARRKLIVIGDSSTIANHPVYRRLLEYFELQDAYGTVWDE